MTGTVGLLLGSSVQYKWRVRAADSTGRTSAWGQGNNFIVPEPIDPIDTPPPPGGSIP